MKKMMLAAGLALCAGIAAGDGTFALRGGVSVPAEARESETYAAKEWCDWSAQVTGWTCAVVSEKDAGVVLRRDDALGEDAFRLKAEKGRLVVSGGRRGVLYGVYEALERFAGVRWFSQNTTVVPKAKAIEVPAALDEVQRPAFELREPQFAELRRNGDLAARLKLNGPQLESRHGGCSHLFDKVLKHSHTMEDLVPYDKYFKDHPEYFAEIDGKRVGFWAQPCLTNPDVLKIVIRGVLERMRANPEVRLFGVSQNDNELYCRCAKCAAVDAEEGSHAGTMIRFVNAVAAETSKEFPQNIISTLAYVYTRKPPKVTKARPDVMPVICSIECEYSTPISAAANEASRSFLADLQGWARMTDRIYVWDYVANFANMTYPFRNTYVLQDNIRLFARNKVKFLYEQGTARYRHAEFSELKAYLISKWMWNPELPIEPMLEEFFAAYYGKAAPAVRRYFDEEHSLPSDPERSPMWIYEDATSQRVTDEFLERAAKIWDEAEALAAGDPHAGYNVRTGRLSVDIPRLMRHRNARENWGALQALAKKTLATIAETGDDVNLDEKVWSKPTYRGDWRKMATMTYEEATADLTATVVPRSEAIVSIDRVLWEPGRRYTLQARVNGGHFRTAVGVRDSNTIRCKTEIGEPKGEGYQWYDVMTGYFQPGQFMSFYSGSPKVTMEAFRLVPADEPSAFAETAGKKRVFLNYDDTHFAHSRTVAGIDPDEAHVRDFVRKYRGTDVTDLLFCIGGRIADVPSKVKDSWCDKFRQTRENGRDVCYTNHYTRLYRDLWEVKKIDIYALWIEEARKAGIRPWLSFRVNDCHDNGAPTSVLHPNFFHEHPEYRRIRHREPIDYFDRCLDFSFAAVRDRELAFIAEMLERYDPDGVEIDWMREIYCFAPGREDASALTGFMREVKRLVQAAAVRRGHPVGVLARVPSDPTTALRYGFDVATWADEGLVDVLAPCPRWYTLDNNLPTDVWTMFLRGRNVVLAPGIETRVIGQPRRGFLSTTGQVIGAAAAFYGAGADGIYLYNYFDDPAWADPEKRYWKAKGGAYHYPFPQPQESLSLAWPNQEKWLRLLGDPARVYASPRLHMLTWRDIAPLGESSGPAFPAKVEKEWLRFFRLETGPVAAGRKAFVRLGVPGGKPPKRVFVNSRPCAYIGNETCEPAFTPSPLCVYEAKDYAETAAVVEVIGEDADLTLDHLDIDIR